MFVVFKFNRLRKLKYQPFMRVFLSQILSQTNKAKFVCVLARKIIHLVALQTGVLQLFRRKAIELLYAAKGSSALTLVHCKVVKTIETKANELNLQL